MTSYLNSCTISTMDSLARESKFLYLEHYMKTTHNSKIQNLMGNHPSTYDGYLVRFGRYLDRCISPDTLCNNLSDDEIIHDGMCQKANKDILKFHTGYNFLIPVSKGRWEQIQKVRKENPNMKFNLS